MKQILMWKCLSVPLPKVSCFPWVPYFYYMYFGYLHHQSWLSQYKWKNLDWGPKTPLLHSLLSKLRWKAATTLKKMNLTWINRILFISKCGKWRFLQRKCQRNPTIPISAFRIHVYLKTFHVKYLKRKYKNGILCIRISVSLKPLW